MKNLARGSVILLLATLFFGTISFTPKAEAAIAIANDSQIKLQQNYQDLQQKTDIQDSTNQNNNKEVLTIEIDNLSDSDAAEMNATLSARAFTATAYCLRGKTASGSGVRRGIVAADPRVLPLGTRISMNAGSYSGSYLVADTGGAVKGRKLDVWVPSCSEAKRFGRKKVMVSVVKKRR